MPRRSAGSVEYISPDLTEDERTGLSYYVARISIPQEEIAKLKGLSLVPGMPMEAFIQTGECTVLSHFLKPLGDFAARASRES